MAMTVEQGIGALHALIDALGVFAEVDWDLYPSDEDPQPKATPYCWIRPKKWTTKESDGDAGNTVTVRTVHFEIEIVTRKNEGSDPETYAAIVQTTVHGKQFYESTSCICDSGTYLKYGGNISPKHRLTILGTFTFEDTP